MKFEAIYTSRLDGGFKVHIYHRVVDPFIRPARFHCHPEYEIGVVRSGHGVYLIGGQSYPMNPGDIFTFSVNEPHYITSVTDGDALHLVNLHFTRPFLAVGEADSPYMRVFEDRPKNFSNRFHTDLREFDAAERILLSDEPFPLPEAKAHLLLFLISLSKTLPAAGPQDSAVLSRTAIKLSGAIDYIDAHLSEHLSLDSIAKAAGLSRGYLSSAFQRSFGVTLWDYINAKRVQSAIRLMHETDMSMLEIALSSGFNSSANFNRNFRHFTAKTPTQYLRESHK